MIELEYSTCIIISNLLAAEKQAIYDYRQAISNISSNNKLKHKLDEIKSEEKIHYDELLAIYKISGCTIYDV